MFEHEIQISRIANGWLLRVPSKFNPMGDVATQILPIIREIHRQSDEIYDPIMAKIKEENEMQGPVIRQHPFIAINEQYHFFASIDEVFQFIKETDANQKS